MRYKISISGSLCSGKTTLTNHILNKMPDKVSVIKEHAWFVKKNFPHIAWDDQVVRDYMLFSQILREKAATESLGIIGICDSGVIEAIAHSEVFGLQPRVDLLVSLKHIRYDIVFINEYKDITLVSNGVRETDPKLQKELHDKILSIAKKMAYDPIILTGNIDERYEVVEGCLDKLR